MFFEDFIHPYTMASASIRNLWSLKRRKYIVDQIEHFLGNSSKCCESSITELRRFALGNIHLQTWELYSLIKEIPIVPVSENEYNELEQIVLMLSNFNNLSIDFYAALRDKTNLEKQGADIMHYRGIWFDSFGAFDRLINETSSDLADEAELEELMILTLKTKFVPKRNVSSKSAINTLFLYSKIKLELLLRGGLHMLI